MSPRSTSMERIEKLRLQLEEAERKEAEKAKKKADAEAARVQKKRDTLKARIDRLSKQAANIAKLLQDTQQELADLDNSEVYAEVELEVVSDDDNVS